MLAAGALAALMGLSHAAEVIWGTLVTVASASLLVAIARALLTRRLGVDSIAFVAMVGALSLGEFLAGAVIAVMWTGGNALEAFAGGRARRELRLLVDRQPRTALRHSGNDVIEVAADALRVGDRVLLRTGDIAPADGTVASTLAIVDESALTGEPLPRERPRGDPIRSGTANAGPVFDLQVTHPASESTYAAIVRLVLAAEANRAPFLRLADRYAGIFLPITLATAAAAWAATGDPVRALAVTVVATPCPLILAAPVALVSGMSRAARSGVIVKGAAVVERLAKARTVLLDKTGTVTTGTPVVQRIEPVAGHSEDDVLRLAASVEQLSSHVVARAIVTCALKRGLRLTMPTEVTEDLGRGIVGTVAGARIRAGEARWALASERPSLVPLAPGETEVTVTVDGRAAGLIVVGDQLRDDAATLVTQLRASGIRSVALLTGDRTAVAEIIGRTIGADRVYSEQTPVQKLRVVESLRALAETRPVVMVGDGINDAPALAAADVGIAIAGGGATVSSETADAVVLVDRVDRIALATTISRRAFHIARQSVILGIGASVIAMVLAAFGVIAPLPGALLQEGIDLAVIVNALRALRVPEVT
jgi:heavy metal translocating P-type ATPase